MTRTAAGPTGRPRRRLALAGGVAIVLAAVVAAAVSLRAKPGHPRIDAGDAGQVALGQAVYAAQCANCHGARLEGQPNWRQRLANGRLPAPPHDAEGHTWHHPDAMLFDITKQGLGPYAPAGYESDMPAFAGALADAEIAAVIAYIKSTWPPDIRARQKRADDAAQAQ